MLKAFSNTETVRFDEDSINFMNQEFDKKRDFLCMLSQTSSNTTAYVMAVALTVKTVGVAFDFYRDKMA